jgi:hypothetical protein
LSGPPKCAQCDVLAGRRRRSLRPGAPCKTVGLAYDGSNPSPATKKTAAQRRDGCRPDAGKGAVRNTAGSVRAPGARQIVAGQRPGRCHATRPVGWFAVNTRRNFTGRATPAPAGARTDARGARIPAGLLPRLDDSGENVVPPIRLQQRLSHAQRISRLRAVAFSHLAACLPQPRHWQSPTVTGREAADLGECDISADTRVIISTYRIEKSSEDHPCILRYTGDLRSPV